MFILPIIFVLSYAEMIPIDNALMEAEAKREDHIEKEIHSPKDHTILSSTKDNVHGYNCVSLVRVYHPDAPSINASDYPVSTTTATVGAIGKIRYHNGVWHVFHVLEVGADTLKVVDGNYEEGFVTVRVIPRSDPRIVGYL